MNERAQFIKAAGEGIRVAYEVLNLTIEQIAEQQELAVSEVKAILYQTSSAYKSEFAGEADEDDVKELYTELARTSTVDAVRERALRFLINEKMGRNDVGLRLCKLKEREQSVGEVDLAMRLHSFNEELKRAREASSNQTQPARLEESVS